MRFRKKTKSLTIADVAKCAGVSTASVSRFLNNPESLSSPYRQRIATIIKKLNYSPLASARHLAGGKTNTIGLIIPGYEGIFYSYYAISILKYTAQALDRARKDLHLNIFHGRDTFNASLVDGVIFADIIDNDYQLQRMIRKKIPIVVMNRRWNDLTVDFVAIDNLRGAYEATEFLISLGHRRIAHLAGDMRVECAQERLKGYRCALKDKNIEEHKDYIKFTDFSRVKAREKIEELFTLKEPPTAVFASSDEIAEEVLRFAKEKTIKVPQELSIIGFDDNPHCVVNNFYLTTVRQPLDKMVYLAVEILNERCREKQKKKETQRIILPPELVIRDTTAHYKRRK